MKKIKIVGSVLIVIFVFLFYAISGKLGEEFANFFIEKGNKVKIDAILVQVSKEINKNTPTNIDSVTILTSTSALPDKKLLYRYMLIYDKNEIDLEYFESEMENRIKNFVKTSPSQKLMRKGEVTFIHEYYDKNMEFLIRITVKPEDYITQ